MKVKFLNLNLLWGGLLFDNIITFLRKEQPDILALQEVYNGKDKKLPRNLRSVEELRKELKDYHFHFAPEAIIVREDKTEGEIEIGNAIFSRFPILEQKIVFFDIPYGRHKQIDKNDDYSRQPRNLAHVVIKANKIPINVVNLHGIWGFSGGDTKRRLQMSKTIVDTISDLENVVLAGDFNLRPDTETIRNIEKHLTNVFKNELVTTFNMRRKTNPSYATAVVDMIFVSKNLKVLEHYSPQVDVSDHFPLVCSFEV